MPDFESEPKAVPAVAVINAARAVVTTLEPAWTLEGDHLDQIVAAARGDKVRADRSLT